MFDNLLVTLSQIEWRQVLGYEPLEIIATLGNSNIGCIADDL